MRTSQRRSDSSVRLQDPSTSLISNSEVTCFKMLMSHCQTGYVDAHDTLVHVYLADTFTVERPPSSAHRLLPRALGHLRMY